MDHAPHRRRFLECMGWAGTGLLWTAGGGVMSSITLDQAAAATKTAGVKPFSFLQVSDSHIGFTKDPNPDARTTDAVARGGYSVVHWTSRGLEFWAVSDIEAKDLKSFEQAFQAHVPS